MMQLFITATFVIGMSSALYLMYFFLSRAVAELDEPNDDDWVP